MNKLNYIILYIFIFSVVACNHSYENYCNELPKLIKFEDTTWYPIQQKTLTFIIEDTVKTDTFELKKEFLIFDIHDVTNDGCPLYFETMRCRFRDLESNTKLAFSYAQHATSLEIRLSRPNVRGFFQIDNFKTSSQKQYYFDEDFSNQSAKIHADSGLVFYTTKHLTLRLIK